MASVSPTSHWPCPPCSYDIASVRLVYPNGLSSNFTYDDLDRLTALNNSKASYNYALDQAGNRKQVTESSGRIVNWSYDGLYRLTNETISLDPRSKNGAVDYGLDPVGNRQTQASSVPGIPTANSSYDADDRILSAETYDANGNTLTSGSHTFTYDFENRLKSMNGTAVTLQYDGDDNRVAKTVGATTTRYLVDDLNPTGYAQVVEELGAAGVQRTYTYGLQRISQNQISATSFYGYDGGGSVRMLTDSTGTVTDTYDYDAWGNTVNVTGTTPNASLYRGEQYDTDLGLYYLRARYFNPLTGRFVTRDTYDGEISDPSTLHKYLYSEADPVNRLDRSGKATTMEYTVLLGALTLATANAIYATEAPIKCIWCKGASQLAAALFVVMLPADVGVIGEVAGRTLCTVKVLTTVATLPWGWTFSRGRGRKGERGRTAKPETPKHAWRDKDDPRRWWVRDPHDPGRRILKPPGWTPPGWKPDGQPE